MLGITVALASGSTALLALARILLLLLALTAALLFLLALAALLVLVLLVPVILVLILISHVNASSHQRVVADGMSVTRTDKTARPEREFLPSTAESRETAAICGTMDTRQMFRPRVNCWRLDHDQW